MIINTGGTKRLATAAEDALQKQDYRWTMRLADYLTALDETAEGKRIKERAMRGLSEIVLPISGKNYLMQSALESQSPPAARK